MAIIIHTAYVYIATYVATHLPTVCKWNKFANAVIPSSGIYYRLEMLFY